MKEKLYHETVYHTLIFIENNSMPWNNVVQTDVKKKTQLTLNSSPYVVFFSYINWNGLSP